MPANEDVPWREDEDAIIPERPENSLDVCDVGSPQSKSVAINWNELKEAIDLGKSLQEEQQRKIDMDIERIQEELHLKDSAEIEVELERMEANVKSLENKKKLIMKAESRSTSHSSGKLLGKTRYFFYEKNTELFFFTFSDLHAFVWLFHVLIFHPLYFLIFFSKICKSLL